MVRCPLCPKPSGYWPRAKCSLVIPLHDTTLYSVFRNSFRHTNAGFRRKTAETYSIFMCYSSRNPALFVFTENRAHSPSCQGSPPVLGQLPNHTWAGREVIVNYYQSENPTEIYETGQPELCVPLLPPRGKVVYHNQYQLTHYKQDRWISHRLDGT